MTRTLVDLDRSATVLDAAERIGGAPVDDDIVVVATAGSPFLRSSVFIDVARRTAQGRRFALVTPDQRARSLAASVHVPAYASVAALERHELDATERLDRARAAVLGRPPRREARPRAPRITRRGLGVAASLAAAAALLMAVVLPEATVVVASTTQPVGPLEVEVRAGPGGDVARTELSGTVTARSAGTATGSREELTKATGAVRLSNKRTEDIRIVRGTLFSTADGVRFLATEERTLPRSVIFFPLTLTVGTVDVPIEAQTVGPPGNVAAGRITVGPRPSDYEVTNPSPTAGGDIKKIPIVQQKDYDLAAGALAQRKLQEAAEIQLARWRTEAKPGRAVVSRVYAKLTSATPANVFVGKEVESFELEVTGIATAYEVDANEPAKTALDRLRALVPGDYALGPDPKVEWQLLDDPSGSGNSIVWRVRASGTALARVDRGRIQRVLAGRGVAEAATQLDRLGVRLESVTVEPPWWPRLPLLDARIQIREVPGTAR